MDKMRDLIALKINGNISYLIIKHKYLKILKYS